MIALVLAAAGAADLDGDGHDGDVDDCDDADEQVYPGAPEVCDEDDDDCDGVADDGFVVWWYPDADRDGFGRDTTSPVYSCAPGPDQSSNPDDCDDDDPAVNPAAPEICDGTDDDCDRGVDEALVFVSVWPDLDHDGYGAGSSLLGCAAEDGNEGHYVEDGEVRRLVSGYVANDDDCNDEDVDVHSGATDVCDARDNDCDDVVDDAGTTPWYEDADGDGVGAGEVVFACEPPGAGWVGTAGDCDDTDPALAADCSLGAATKPAGDSGCGCAGVAPDASLLAFATLLLRRRR